MTYETITKCPMCRHEGGIVIVGNDVWEYAATQKDPAYSVEGIHCYHCLNCDEKFTNKEMDKHNHPKTIDAYRKAKGLLTSDQLALISEILKASDQEIERVLGFGERTFSRWKNAHVCQSESHDALLRAVIQYPSFFFEIAEKKEIQVLGRRRGRPALSA
jgi:putative zinc finger/helix-turn-helix YgiT family protein